MSNKLKKLYYDTRCGFQIIGCLLKKHSILSDINYALSSDDFHLDFHKGIFSAIHNLLIEGIEEITPVEIEAYLSRTSPRYYKIVFDDNDGFDWMEESLQHSSLANLDYNYARLRKMSYLRDMIAEGIDVSDLLDLQEIDNGIIESQNKHFDSLPIEYVIKFFENKVNRHKNKYDKNGDGSYKRAGDRAEETLKRLKNGENYGLMCLSGYKNRIAYGARRKKFHLVSSPTGGGKSRYALSEIGFLIAQKIWDYEKKCFVINPNNPKGELSGIYIGTELELDMEVDVILMATVSGLETSKIVEMELNEEEEWRLNYAIQIIQDSKIHLYDRPNYDIATLESIVKKHQTDEDVYILGIDYILLTGNLVLEAREYSKNMWTREDQLFLFISKCFKERIANALNVYVSSSTQLNRSSSDKSAEKDAGMIRGSFALTDKVDTGSLILEIETQELEKIDSILKKQGWASTPPTHIEHVFKNRGGKFSKVRIFRSLNLGNMCTTDLFCTDWDYKLIDIEQIFATPFEELEEKEEEVLF